MNSSSDEIKDDKPLRAAIYGRVSTGRQSFGYSLDEQIRQARELCKLKQWKISYIFREDAESGSTTDRPKFQMMLMKAKDCCFDVLVFWKLDRFCRSLRDVVNVEKYLRECGISLFSLTEQIDTTTAFGRFNFRNIASAAELESDLIKERTILGLKALAHQHKWPNKNPPLGYDIKHDGCLLVNSSEKNLVIHIFKRYVRIKSMPQLAFELNKKGISTKNGKKWSAASIKHILCNQIYLGLYAVAGVEAEIKEYKIISKRLFHQVQIVRKRYAPNIGSMNKKRKKEKIDKVISEFLSFINEEELDI